jgi:anhydro-N-acetylmuramic acid kinase
VAAGGHGAPLVPIFHQAVFAQPGHAVAVLNIGGMANVSLLAPSSASPACSPLGFDCGPGNVLMDLWSQRQRGLPFDEDGAWARRGQVQPQWLARALAEPYFALPPPKSTGRDLFHTAWLEAWLQGCGVPAQPTPAQAADVQATLCELTAISCVQALGLAAASPGATWLSTLREMVVCGGGALNGHLMTRLQAALAEQGASLGLPGPLTVVASNQRGLPPMQVEAAAFAWLAWACVNRQAGNVPAVTGAQGPRVLGAVYPA